MAQPHSPPILPMTDVLLTTVQPLHKAAHIETIDPTFMDAAMADLYVSIFFAYRQDDNSKTVYSQVVKRIKESLQKVLVPFFSFGGRWIAVPEGSRGRKLLCNDAGVPLIEAYVEKDLDSVVQASSAFRPVPELQGFGVLGMDATKLKQQMKPDGLPPIFVQITRFKCGGLVLALTFNHMHTDGRGLFNFMTAWCDISRTGETALEVDHNRAQLDVPAMSAFYAGIDLNKVAFSDEAGGGGTAPKAPTPEPWVFKAFEVEASVIETLKLGVKGRNEGTEYVSTGDCIVAHLWKSVASLPSKFLGDRELTVGLTVDGRTLFYDPPAPNVCGNAATAMLTPEIAVEEVKGMPLVSLASRLRNKLQATKREEWLDILRLVKVGQAYGNSSVALLNVTSWFKLPMYGLDFGFGRPFFCSGPNAYEPMNAIASTYIGPPIPSSPSSIAVVYVLCKQEVLEALEGNPYFPIFFS